MQTKMNPAPIPGLPSSNPATSGASRKKVKSKGYKKELTDA